MTCLYCHTKKGMILDRSSGLWTCSNCKLVINTLNMYRLDREDLEEILSYDDMSEM